MLFISEKIRDEYLKWNNGDVVFITAPTGSGKTYFILNKLVSYVSSQGKKLLYLVNRRILKQQLEADISRLSIKDQNAIIIKSYQALEVALQKKDINTLKHFSEFDYIVCDEAHYFSSDALFNTNTELVYRWIRCYYANKVRVFISATLDLVKDRIEEDEFNRKSICTPIYMYPCTKSNIHDYLKARKPWVYIAEIDYSYLNCQAINDITDIYGDICNSSEKWLIFVDSKEYGMKLKKSLEKENVLKGSVIFLSTDYRRKLENIYEVESIAQTQKQSAKVLICTSVMDNGISLKDLELRNLVIQTDIKTEFIQMLGRKRNDGKQTKLYLINKTVGEINERLYEYGKIKELCAECMKYLFNMENEIKYKYGTMYTQSLFQPIECNRSEQIITDLQKIESNYILRLHDNILPEVLGENSDRYKKFLYADKGVLLINLFSIRRVEYLCDFYAKLLDALRNNPYALAEWQLSWLGKDLDEVEEIVTESQKSQYSRSWENVDTYLNSIVCKIFDEQEFIKVKLDLKDDLQVLVREYENKDPKGAKTILDNLSKNDRVLSTKNFKWLCEYCDLKYAEEQTRQNDDKRYIIKRYE